MEASLTLRAQFHPRGPETYTGGTGRFADASGSALVSGTAELLAGTGRFTSEGKIRY